MIEAFEAGLRDQRLVVKGPFDARAVGHLLVHLTELDDEADVRTFYDEADACVGGPIWQLLTDGERAHALKEAVGLANIVRPIWERHCDATPGTWIAIGKNMTAAPDNQAQYENELLGNRILEDLRVVLDGAMGNMSIPTAKPNSPIVSISDGGIYGVVTLDEPKDHAAGLLTRIGPQTKRDWPSERAMSWVGIQVRHSDGRVGQIRRDAEGFLHRSLRIDVDGGGSEWVQLNVDGEDSGATGWEWKSRSSDWYALGDHNKAEA